MAEQLKAFASHEESGQAKVLSAPLCMLAMRMVIWVNSGLLAVQKLAGADHTTLLLNCYTKLKDVSKLDAFLRGSGASEGSSALPFDAETAVKVSLLS